MSRNIFLWLISIVVFSIFTVVILKAKAEEELKAKPIKLEYMTPTKDLGGGNVSLFADIQKDVYNPEEVPFSTSSWKMDYTVGRRLYQKGDYKRAAIAFQTALLELDGFDKSDSRYVMTEKALDMARGLTTERGKLGYDTSNKNKGSLTGKVTKVFPPSLAWLAGLKTGDIVLKGSAAGDTFKLTVRRQGRLKTLTLKARSPELASTQNSRLKARVDKAKLKAGASETKPFPHSEKILSDYDCCLLVDCSGSMSSPMAPGTGYDDYTRWSWCGEESYNFLNNARKYFPSGITVVPFNNQFSIKDHVNINDISDLFDTVKPFGQTNIESPLSYILSSYFAKRKSGFTKPLSITVLTDGIANMHNIGNVIIQATENMKEKREIVITFLEVDEAYMGEEILNALDNQLVDAGARYDIVHVRDFHQLLGNGLKESIVSTLIEAQR